MLREGRLAFRKEVEPRLKVLKLRKRDDC